MKTNFSINNQTLALDWVKRKNSRNIKLTIRSRDCILVSSPRWVTEPIVNEFLIRMTGWIEEKIQKIDKMPYHPLNIVNAGDYKANKKQARKYIQEKVDSFNQFYGYEYNRISIRNQQTRWGSCSSKKNLNFNYKVAQLPSHLADYIIVHEICHLKEMNHSLKFWELVRKTIPRCDVIRKELNSVRLNPSLLEEQAPIPKPVHLL